MRTEKGPPFIFFVDDGRSILPSALLPGVPGQGGFCQPGTLDGFLDVFANVRILEFEVIVKLFVYDSSHRNTIFFKDEVFRLNVRTFRDSAKVGLRLVKWTTMDSRCFVSLRGQGLN